MNTAAVNKALQTSSIFKGTFPRNCIPTFKSKPYAVVVNTDSSSEPGEHWVAIVVLKNNWCEYFDPFGFPPCHKQILSYLNKHSRRYRYNCKTLQDANSKSCGKYCIAFIKHKQKSLSMKSFIKKFSKNTVQNEKILIKYN